MRATSRGRRSRRQGIRKAIIFISALLFPITIYYLSPMLVIEASSRGVVNGSLIIFALQLLSSLFLGRAFCGWVCPGAGLGEAAAMAWQAPAPGGRWNWIKYVLWVPWLGAIIYLAMRAGGYHEVSFLLGTWHGISVHDGPSFIVYYFFVFLIVGLAWKPGRRGFCHYVCWMAPFMVIGDYLRRRLGWRGLHLEVVDQGCSKCGVCDKRCPMSLEVRAMVEQGSLVNSECTLCGTCVDNCPRGVIGFRW